MPSTKEIIDNTKLPKGTAYVEQSSFSYLDVLSLV
jgi:hypothetical protein